MTFRTQSAHKYAVKKRRNHVFVRYLETQISIFSRLMYIDILSLRGTEKNHQSHTSTRERKKYPQTT